MNELIGRRGGGGGGHGHGHHGGHVHRFHFGAPAGEYDGYGWGPIYSWPWAEEYVDEGGVQDYVGADWRGVLTAMAPGASGVTYDIAMDPDMVLHVVVRVDGRAYQADVSLPPLLEGRIRSQGGTMTMSGRHHGGGHGHHHHHHHRHEALQDQGQPQDPQADQEIESAGMIVVGQLLDHHCRTVTAGWWDDVSGSASSVGDAIQSTVRTFKGPLSEVAGNMAASYASAYGGPAAGMIAKNLAGSLVNAAAGDDHAAGNAAKQAIEQAKAAAVNNPNVAAALDSARKAVAQMTGAYHIASTADQATSGEPRAVLAINQLHAAAGAGDASAQHGLRIAQEVKRVATSSPSRATSRVTYAPPGSYAPRRPTPLAHRKAPRPTTAAQVNLARAAIERLRAAAREAVLDANLQHGDTALGFVQYADGAQVQAFASSDDADDWLRDLDPGDLVYAAYYDQGDPTWPTPLNELFGTVVQGTDRDSVVSGALPLIPFLFGAAAGGAGYAWWHHHHHHAHPAAQTTAPASGTTAPVTTSGEVDGARADAIVAAQELHRQNGATYVGYAKTRGGGTSDRGDGVVVTVEDTAMVQSFPTFDALSRWFNQASEQEDYLYLACFDASSQAWPAPIGSIAAPARTTSASRGAWTASRR